jgi:hypothetical protein
MSSLDGKTLEEIQQLAFNFSSTEFKKEYLISLTEQCFDKCVQSQNENCVESCSTKFKKSFTLASEILTEK